MKTSKLLLVVAVFAFMFAAAARAELAPYGEITGVTADGGITINTGTEIGFEAGDILVIQRKGLKVGLVHIVEAKPNSAVGKLVSAEQGVSPQAGDFVAYQLLDDTMAINWPLPAGKEFRETPDIMRREWQSPAILTMNLDRIINEQISALQKHPYSRSSMIILADAYFKKAWYEHSIMWSQKAIEANPAAEDTDKLIYQIIRCYGYLNQPERQALYISFLNKSFPNSVFAAMELSMNTIEGRMAEFKRNSRTITDVEGFKRSGMRYQELDGINYNRNIPVKRLNIQSHLEGLEGKLLHASPIRISPTTTEPTYYQTLQDKFHE